MASVVALKQRLTDANAAVADLKAKVERATWELNLALRAKESLEAELRRTKERLARADRFVAAQTAYLAGVLDPGKP